MESPVPPVSSDEVMHTLLTDDVTARKQVLEVSSEPMPITMDDIHEAQSAYNKSPTGHTSLEGLGETTSF